jgi:hypothetical protein
VVGRVGDVLEAVSDFVLAFVLLDDLVVLEHRYIFTPSAPFAGFGLRNVLIVFLQSRSL